MKQCLQLVSFVGFPLENSPHYLNIGPCKRNSKSWSAYTNSWNIQWCSLQIVCQGQILRNWFDYFFQKASAYQFWCSLVNKQCKKSDFKISVWPWLNCVGGLQAVDFCRWINNSTCFYKSSSENYCSSTIIICHKHGCIVFNFVAPHGTSVCKMLLFWTKQQETFLPTKNTVDW